MSSAKDASDQLAQRIAAHAGACNGTYIDKIHIETESIRLWVGYLYEYEKTGFADELLLRFSSSIVEVASCLTIGMARIAMGPLRAQIDIVLSWLYFKDHPVEWRRLIESGDGYVQKSEVLKYLDKYVPGFSTRFALLKASKKRSVEDPFSLLSAHLHKQSPSTLVALAECADVVCESAVCDEVVAIQASVSEYINDVLMSCFYSNWAALPGDVTEAIRARMTPAQEKAFFSS